jgi:tetratricopeptide (TPR) repeat protein
VERLSVSSLCLTICSLVNFSKSLFFDQGQPEIERKAKAQLLLAEAQRREEQITNDKGQPESIKAHAALGDLTVHRLQYLVLQGKYHECENIFSGWSAAGNTPSKLERHITIHKETALAHVRIAQGKHDEAVAKLKRIVNQTVFDAPDAMRKSTLNWGTCLLAEEYCWKGGEGPNSSQYFREVINLLQPRIEELLTTHSERELITSDFRLLVCEAHLRLQEYDIAEELLQSLQRDLLLPSKIRNPRRDDQLFSTKQTLARAAHLRGQWEEAVKKWYDALQHVPSEGVNDYMIASNSFKRSYDTDLSIFSLGVALLHNAAEKKKGRRYIAIAEGKGSKLGVFPKGKVDYTRWAAYVREEHRKLTRWGYNCLYRVPAKCVTAQA